MIYSKLLIYLQVTDQSESYYTFTLLTVLFQQISSLATLFSLLTVCSSNNQRASYYTFFFIVYMYKKKNVATLFGIYVRLLLMELNYV